MQVEGGTARITPAMPPMVAIPTTAGTGSEVGRAGVFVMADGRKLGVPPIMCSLDTHSLFHSMTQLDA
jgi:alcohol dehydrogenase class IV